MVGYPYEETVMKKIGGAELDLFVSYFNKFEGH